MDLNTTLKEKRIANQYTQQELADRIQVSKRSISNWESGRTIPDLQSIVKLAKLYDISLDSLLLDRPELVSNIQRQSELDILKKNVILTSVTNYVIMFIVLYNLIHPSSIALPLLIALAVGMISNYVVVIKNAVKQTDFLKKYPGDYKQNGIDLFIHILLLSILILLIVLSINNVI